MFVFYVIAVNFNSLTCFYVIIFVVVSYQIVVLSQLYSLIATKVNNWENHRTDTVHENSLVRFHINNSAIVIWSIVENMQ